MAATLRSTLQQSANSDERLEIDCEKSESENNDSDVQNSCYFSICLH